MESEATRLRADVRSLRRWAIFAAVVGAVGIAFLSSIAARQWSASQAETRAASYLEGRDSAQIAALAASVADLRGDLQRQWAADASAREAVEKRLDNRVDDVSRELDFFRGATLKAAADYDSKIRVLDSRMDWTTQQLASAGIMDPRWGDPKLNKPPDIRPASEPPPKEP